MDQNIFKSLFKFINKYMKISVEYGFSPIVESRKYYININQVQHVLKILLVSTI